MSLTDDIFDAGVLAFYLLDGVEQIDDSKSIVVDDNISMAARSHAAFKKKGWSTVSSYCKELI